MVSRREIMTRVDGNTACLAGLLLTDLFRPVSLISHSRAKDQNDFCSVRCSHTPGVDTRSRPPRIPVIIFSHFSAEIILETNGPLKPPDRIINLGSRMAGRARRPRRGVDERLQRP